MTVKTLEDDLVEVVGTLVIEVALHQRRMRLAMRLGVVGLILIAATFAGAVYLSIDTRSTVARSPCATLTAPRCFRRLVTNATPRTLAILKQRLAAQESRARQRERRRLNRRHDSGPRVRPAAAQLPRAGLPASTTTPTRGPTPSRPPRHGTSPATPGGSASDSPPSGAPPPAPRPLIDIPAPTVTTPAGTVTAPSVCARPVGGIGC